MSYYPAVGFYFSLSFSGDISNAETSFKEVSGLTMEMDTESIEEGGVNDYTHIVPKRRKHQNLVLKRGYSANQELTTWCEDAIMGGLLEGVYPETLTVKLLNENGTPLKSWSFYNAWPVKWELSPFDSEKNEVVIESIEFAYSYFKSI
ncbi:MAG: phage tail protein [Crocinitomicaceae bacterium]|nr:phage tail protein [Crocinitomicaceae bacterium]